MTRADHPSGTDRLAEVAATLRCDVIVNVQGDEPLIEPAMIADALAPFAADPRPRDVDAVPPLRRPRTSSRTPTSSRRWSAATATRSISRARRCRSIAPTGNSGVPASAFKHIGLYAYRRATLLRLAALAPTPLEDLESLEQLRALEHGIRIRVVETALRFDWRRHRRRRRARARHPLVRAPERPLRRTEPARRVSLAGHHAKPQLASRQVHLRHRRRRLVARQGSRRRLDRLPARGPRLSRSRCRSSTPTSTSTRGR